MAFNLSDPLSFRVSVGNLITNYSYKIEISTKTETGEEGENQFITVTSNDLLTEDQLLSTSRSYWDTGNYGEGLSIDTMTITDALRSKALGE